MNRSSLSYTILALAPFTHETVKPWEEKAVFVESADFSEAMDLLQPSLYLHLPKNLCSAEGIEISFTSLKDFTPDGLIASQSYLKDLVKAKEFLENSMRQGLDIDQIKSQFQKWSHLPDILLQKTFEKDSAPQGDVIDSILSMVAMPDEDCLKGDRNTSGVEQLEDILQQILTILMQNQDFQAMEGAWRGLQLLFDKQKTTDQLRIEIVPVVLNNLEETLDNLMSDLLLNPPSLLVVDIGFNSSSRSMELLVDLAELGNTILAPVVAWIEPQFFQITKWEELEQLAYLPNYLDNSSFAKWKKLQNTPAGKWLALTCNRVLGRFPYGKENEPRKIKITERHFLWVAPVWAISVLFSQAISRYSWPVGINLYRQQRLDNLPLDTSHARQSKPVEFIFSDEKLEQLASSGIIVLRSLKDSAFITNDIAVSLDVTLSYQALVSRFVQLVITARDLLDQQLEAKDLEVQFLKKLSQLFERQGTLAGDNLIITASSPDKDGKIPVKVSWLPPENIPASNQELRLDFLW